MTDPRRPRPRLPARSLLLLAGLAAACGPPPAVPAPPGPETLHRAALLRPDGLFLQLRLHRLRPRLPGLAEVAAIAAAPDLPGASCLVDLVWSADVASLHLATHGRPAPSLDLTALLAGEAIPADRVVPWADCVLAGLGSGRATRRFPLPSPAPDAPPAPELEATTGTGRWADLGILRLPDGDWLLTAGAPVEDRAAELLRHPAPPPPPVAAEVADADLAAVWTDGPAVATLLDELAAGFAPVPTPEEVEGLALGLWVGDRPRLLLAVRTRGREAAAAVAALFGTAAAVLQLNASVAGALLGREYGEDVQQRAERVAALAARGTTSAEGPTARYHLDLAPEELDLLQAFALALAARRLID